MDTETTGISLEELQLAARNHGLPLEVLREPVTPVGLHYLLVHYDIPAVDPDAWRLTIGGAVERELSLGLPELRERAARELVATMECAGNGRARLTPRPVSQPWLLEAVGTGRWHGVPLRSLLDEARVGAGAVEVLFTGLDRGIEGEVEQQYERSLPLEEAMRDDVLLAYELNGLPLPAQHGYPLRLVVPGWYGMTNVKWLGAITVLERPFAGYQQVHGYRLRQSTDEPGSPVTRMQPRSLMVPPGIPDFMTRARTVPRGPVHVARSRLVGVGAGRARRGERRRRRHVVGGGARGRRPRRLGVASVDVHLGCERAGGDGALLPRRRRRREPPAERAAVERRRLLEQRGAARRRHHQGVTRTSTG